VGVAVLAGDLVARLDRGGFCVALVMRDWGLFGIVLGLLGLGVRLVPRGGGF
jgi:hypothetical protein